MDSDALENGLSSCRTGRMAGTGRVSNMKLLLVVALSVPLAACNTSGSRPCSSFDLPQAVSWSTVGGVGETATFRDASGASLSLTLLSREDNAPYEGFDRFGAEEVGCRKTSTRRYAFDDPRAGLAIEFVQIEGFEQATEDQVFFISAALESPLGEPLDVTFPFSARNPIVNNADDGFADATSPRRTRVLDDVDIGEARYAFAVEVRYADPDTVRVGLPDGVPPISGVVFADGGGLVRIDYASGERFVRVGPPRP